MSTPLRPPAPPAPRPSALLTFADLVSDLVWPQLLKAGPLALRPTRVILGMFLAVALVLIIAAGDAIDGTSTRKIFSERLTQNALNIGAWLQSLSKPKESAYEAYQFFFATPWLMVRESPWVAPLVLLGTIGAWTLLGGAISRTVACDYAHNRALSLWESIRFMLAKCSALLGSMLTPLLIVWAGALVIALGSLLLRVPVLNSIAGLGFGVALLVGVVCAIVTIAYALGHPMLVPSVACEGSDSIDAVQRAYAFVLAKPLRLVLYVLLLFVQGVVLAIVVFTLITLAQHLVLGAGRAWGGDGATAIFAEWSARLANAPADPVRLSGDQSVARFGVGMWVLLLNGVGVGIMVSYIWTASTLLYLAMRRVCDGQDMTDIWTERLVPGTLAEMSTPKPATTQGVSDTGPADET